MNKEELKKKIREIVHNHQDGVVFQELENSCVNELTTLFTEIEEKTGDKYTPPEGYSITKELAKEVYAIVSSDKPYYQRVDALGVVINRIRREAVEYLLETIKYWQENDPEFDEGMVNTEYFIGLLEKKLSADNKFKGSLDRVFDLKGGK